MMSPALRERLEVELGSSIEDLRQVGGGDINVAHHAWLTDGREVFIKTHPRTPAGAFAAEAAGLQWLRVEGGPAIPRVVSSDDAWLVLEWVESGAPVADYDERLGRELARLHGATPDRFGLADDNFIANLPQSNRRHDTWARFYAEERVLPLATACTHRGIWTAQTQAGFEALVARMEERVGEPEPPARLHGDLWSGNAMPGVAGEPMLIDPAAYGGHREVDLAMMKLFGGFSSRCFDAYDECYPLLPGWEDRIDLWQLYPLLVHALLFGRGYAGRCVEVMRRWL